jgi:hypothetical protein
LCQNLATGPDPRPYRRIRPVGDGFVIAVKDWRASFVVEGGQITVVEIHSGYRLREIADSDDPEHGLHKAFIAAFAHKGPVRVEPCTR